MSECGIYRGRTAYPSRSMSRTSEKILTSDNSRKSETGPTSTGPRKSRGRGAPAEGTIPELIYNPSIVDTILRSSIQSSDHRYNPPIIDIILRSSSTVQGPTEVQNDRQ